MYFDLFVEYWMAGDMTCNGYIVGASEEPYESAVMADILTYELLR